jgi:hypothetical protein
VFFAGEKAVYDNSIDCLLQGDEIEEVEDVDTTIT